MVKWVVTKRSTSFKQYLKNPDHVSGFFYVPFVQYFFIPALINNVERMMTAPM